MRVFGRLTYTPRPVRVLLGLALGITGLIVLAGIILSPTVVVSQNSALPPSAASGSAPVILGNAPVILSNAPLVPRAEGSEGKDLSQATPVPPDNRQHYVRGDSNIVFRWSKLVDSLALVVSYAWLCCGALIVVALPVFFVVLWVKARNRRQA